MPLNSRGFRWQKVESFQRENKKRERGRGGREREKLERQMLEERNFIRRPDTLNNAAACSQHRRRAGGARLRFRHGKGVLKSKALHRLILY